MNCEINQNCIDCKEFVICKAVRLFFKKETAKVQIKSLHPDLPEKYYKNSIMEVRNAS